MVQRIWLLIVVGRHLEEVLIASFGLVVVAMLHPLCQAGPLGLALLGGHGREAQNATIRPSLVARPSTQISRAVAQRVVDLPLNQRHIVLHHCH